jgi:hypothetical protein
MARVGIAAERRARQPDEVMVENSWSLPTGGPLGRDDLWKSPRDLLAASQSTRSRAGQATHHRRDEEIRQPIMMAPHGNAGLIGKARPRTLSVADNYVGVESHPAPPEHLVLCPFGQTD